MPELRKDPVLGRWVIIATERAKQPQAFTFERAQRDPQPVCPFCPGNESMTPPEVLAYRKEGTRPDEKGWWVRVVRSKYPALTPDDDVVRSGDGMYDLCSGAGAHEVVIETPDHAATLGRAPTKQIEEVIWAYKARFLELSKDPRFRYVMVFRNEGIHAGASLDHPHTQIIALPTVPKRVEDEIAGARRHFQFKERCIFCDIMRQELQDEVRLVETNDHFVSFAPFAPRFPYECWIVPRVHRSHFRLLEKDEVTGLAHILSSTVGRLERALDSPPYNLAIHTSPTNTAGLPHYHWHVEITPALSTIAGFEWGAGMFINPVPPEDAAAALREAKVDTRKPAARPAKKSDEKRG